MKYIIPLLLLFCLTNCRKNENQNQLSSTRVFTFESNGVNYDYSNDTLLIRNIGSINNYGIICAKVTTAPYNYDIRCEISFHTSQVAVGTYYNGFPTLLNSEQSTFKLEGSNAYFSQIKNGDYTNLVISKIENNLADGTFSGVLSLQVNNSTFTQPITNGVFKNIPIQ